MVAVVSCHPHRGWRNTNPSSYTAQEVGGSDAGFTELQPSGGIIRFLFRLLEATHAPWAMKLPPPPKAAALLLCAPHPHHITPDALPPSSSIFRDPGDYIGPTQTVQEALPISGQLISDFNSICNLKSPLQRKVTDSQALGSTAGTSLGAHCSAHRSHAEATGSVVLG